MKHLLVIGILIISAVTFAFGECSDADKKALEAFDRAWGQAGEKGDKDALMAIYADDYTGLPGMLGKTQTIENTMQAFEANKANPTGDVVTPDNYFISCTGNTATITHRNVITTKFGPGGKEATIWTRSIHFLEKRGGKWQVVSNAGGSGLDEYDTIGYMELDWNTAIKNRDMSWMEKNYAADMSDISSSTGRLMNKKQSIEDTNSDKSVYDVVETTGMNIRVDGNMAVVTGIFHMKGRDDKGQPVERRLRFTDTFIRRDGRWQVWATQGTLLK